MAQTEMLLAPGYDRVILLIYLVLICLGLVMVASAVEIDKHWEQEGSPWYNFFEEIELTPTCGNPGCPG